MNSLYFIVALGLSIGLSCCNGNHQKKTSLEPDLNMEIPEITTLRSKLHYDNKKSLWTLDNIPYSGYSCSFYPENIPKEKFGIINGKKQNEAVQWYPDGHFKQIAYYHKGKLHGEKKIWSQEYNHVLIAHLNYKNGKAHGEQKKWYLTGELFKKLNLSMGREEGIQQAFRKNGDLYANYEARNGRIFGLKKSALCYGIEDEKIKYEE